MNGNTNDCGCCAGISPETPEPIDNRPGLPEISYRTGTHREFLESMKARLSSSDYPALARLTARDDADFAIALCDSAATVLDILTFYQERIANENFLHTATERRSILELARLIGYELAPGVAASTYLAFTLQSAPGAIPAADEAVPIPRGTRVQSVPGPGEEAQTFETVEDIEGRAVWSAMPVQTTAAWMPQMGDTDLYLAGVSTGLQTGDIILIVGQERERDLGSERWDIRVLNSVEPSVARGWTRVAWSEGLGHASPFVRPSAEAPRVFVFRQRAAFFGHNAPDSRLMTKQSGSELEALIDGSGVNRDWKNHVISPTALDLDAAYPKIVAGSWFALVSNRAGAGLQSLPGYIELYRAVSVSSISRTDFGLSGKITRLVPDTNENLTATRFTIRSTLVLAQSEPVAATARPLGYPLYGAELALANVQPDLAPGRTLAVTGKRQRVVLADSALNLQLQLDGGGSINLTPGDSLRLDSPPEQVSGASLTALGPAAFRAALPSTATLRLRLRDRDDQPGTLDVQASLILLAPALDDDPNVSEIVNIDSAAASVKHTRDRTVLILDTALQFVYDRYSVQVSGNVAQATQGERVTETAGSGAASQPNQAFGLRQTPLTYVSAPTAAGRASTIEVRVNDLLWSEVPSLYGQPATAPVYTLLSGEAGSTTVLFGDGIEGARLPTGQDNVRLLYRKGLGTAGNLVAGRLSNLLSRPLSVNAVVNPVAAAGGQDAEAEDAARENAPRTVLTLDRAVSVQDYEDFARSFAGIAKAQATWIAAGPGRGVFVSISGAEGAAIPSSSATYHNLMASLRNYGDAMLPLILSAYRPAYFRLRVAVRVAADGDSLVVFAAAEQALRTAFGFDKRSFGQMVSVDEIAAVLHTVPGIEAVNIIELRRTDQGLPLFQPRLFAHLPEASLSTLPQAAELLLLDAGPISLEQMQ